MPIINQRIVDNTRGKPVTDVVSIATIIVKI
jgi:hypothetical protein